MVKTIRLSDDELHKEFLKIQGEIQARTGEFTNSDDAMREILRSYRKKKQ